MTEKVFEFTDNDLVGVVAAVDTARVSISVLNAPIVSHLAIGHLVAIKGTTEAEYLIALIDRVTRGLVEAPTTPTDDGADIPVAVMAGDVVRVSLIGTFRSVDGRKTNVFKRGAD